MMGTRYLQLIDIPVARDAIVRFEMSAMLIAGRKSKVPCN